MADGADASGTQVRVHCGTCPLLSEVQLNCNGTEQMKTPNPEDHKLDCLV